MTNAKIARILVAVDFDEASAAALIIAASLARAWGATLSVFHAASEDVPAYFTASQLDRLEEERAQSDATVAGQLRAFAERHAGRVADVIVGDGPAPDAIVRLAAEFDVIAVGTHRRHGVSRWWLGSVAEATVRRSPRPVLVVPAGAVVRARPTLLVAGADATADAWASAMSTAVDGTVVRASDIGHCTADRLDQAEVLVLPVPAAATRAWLAELTRVLTTCRHPVLFIPSEGTPERNSS
jgi:nucleotide-binding universal stress UspA family protein